MTIKEVILEIENVENQLSSMMVEDAKTDLNLLKNEISKLRSLSELNELSSFVEDCKTMLGKMSLTIGAKVWVVQKTKKTEGVITKINQKKMSC